MPAVEIAQLGYLEGKFSTRMKDEALVLDDSSLRYWHEEKERRDSGSCGKSTALLPLGEPGTASGQAGCQQLISSGNKGAPK